MKLLKPVSILQLTGVWVLDKSLSDDMDPLVKLQSLSWILRQVLKHITITFTITESATTTPATKDSTPSSSLQVDILHTATGGITGTTEKRILDWKPHVHHDHVYKTLTVRSRLISGETDSDGRVRPAVQLHGAYRDGERVCEFLRGKVSADGKEDDGFLVEEPGCVLFENVAALGCWVHTVSCSEALGWVMEQTWGFEMIDGERYHTRRVVVADNHGDFALGRAVCKWQGPVGGTGDFDGHVA
ncbi:hypothetical protein BDW42DRAFT_172644 [Aspergillus taichungensis]|uniref:Uncharacterized protein n=1 Tax=Aspergillus taichungensis TaxID=482145 RepID=A0A2J5HQF1_9EURO|nr:hypothetical protein BDW42DRAFT_172644 [Aspergillus taichungensis]